MEKALMNMTSACVRELDLDWPGVIETLKDAEREFLDMRLDERQDEIEEILVGVLDDLFEIASRGTYHCVCDRSDQDVEDLFQDCLKSVREELGLS